MDNQGTQDVSYGTLYEYLDRAVTTSGCDCTLKHARNFAAQHGLPYDALRRRLEKHGGFCDCEVLFNVTEYIPANEMIAEATNERA